MQAPAGAALRRALVEPALACGFRFEDQALVEAMLAEVEGERGALPLVAFAAAELWDRRDREADFLSRAVYQQIGGVAGALARHADATLERIGSRRIPIVRELFRNLTTAQGTRAARDREELLSIFEGGDRDAAVRVLTALIDARLLTSYEVWVAESEEEGHRRIEIIHESLLTAWPRLVRWQTQDTDGAQLRDQLRQAAQTWVARGRPGDLLWRGTAFREFQLWRERYPGGLTETEESFATAMTSLAARRRRRRRILLTTGGGLLLAVLAVVTALWRQSVLQTRRAEAQKLLALGQVELETHPTGALAWARASLELIDTPEGRIFASRALSRGPVARLLDPEEAVHSVSFSPDGEWAALEGYDKLNVQHRSGGPAAVVDVFPTSGLNEVYPYFDAAGRRLSAWKAYGERNVQEVRTYSYRLPPSGAGETVPELVEVSRTEEEIGEYTGWRWYRTPKGLYEMIELDDGQTDVRLWPFSDQPSTLGRIEACDGVDFEPGGDRLACRRGQQVFLYSLEHLETPPRKVCTLERSIRRVRLHPALEWIAVQEQDTQTVTGWPLSDDASEPLWSFESRGLDLLEVDPGGSRIAEAGMLDGTATAFVWDLGSPGADPLRLRYPNTEYLNGFSFDPSGRWLVTATVREAAFWPLPVRSTMVFPGDGERVKVPAFTPDGESLVTVGFPHWDSQEPGILRLRPLVEGAAERELAHEFSGLSDIRMHPEGRFLVAGGSGSVMVLPLDGSKPTRLEGFENSAVLKAVAHDAERQLVAVAPSFGPRDQKVIRVWSLRDGSVRVLAADDAGDGRVGCYFALEFLPDGRLLSCGQSGIRRWSLEDGSFETLLTETCGDMVITPGGRVAVAKAGPGRSAAIDLDSGEMRFVSDLGLVHDLDGDGGRQLAGFRPSLLFAIAPGGDVVAAASEGGVIQVGRLSGGEPHFLFGHQALVTSLAFSPDGLRLASADAGGTIRVWPVPDLSKPPFHTLPYDALMAKLDRLTNLRVVADVESSTGYSFEVGRFPGWAEVPRW